VREEDIGGARVLGEIAFPTSTRNAQAQQAFIQGMLLLHLFEYPFAEERFQRARALDPGFAMAYWGEAMTHNHPIWDEQDRDQARAVLNQLGAGPGARQSLTPSQKEKDYLAALDILYGDGGKAERDQAYMRYMEAMAERYPDDDEVRLLYALALMGTTAGVRDYATYMQSAAAAQSVFYRNRRHPGAAHYLIHAVDDPIHAPLGLEAAYALAEMAPDAGHSLHMTTHIFTATGMWDEVVDLNRAAIRVANGMRVIRGQVPRHWGHYNFWLLYGLLQQGNDLEARQLLQAAYDETREAGVTPDDPLVLDPDRSQVGSLVQMWARYLIEVRGQDQVVARWTFDMGEAYDPQLNWHYVHSLMAAWNGETDRAAQHLARFRELGAALEQAVMALERQAPTDLLYLDRLQVLEREMLALVAWSRGAQDEALSHAREASRLEGDMPFSFGPPFVDLPAAELLAELLTQAGMHDEAIAMYTLQIQRTRGKTLAVRGLAAARQAAPGADQAACCQNSKTGE